MTFDLGLTAQATQGRGISRRVAIRGVGGSALAAAATVLVHDDIGAQATPSSCPSQDSLTANKNLIRQMTEVAFNEHNPAAFDQFMAPDYVEHHVPIGVPPTLEALKKDLTQLFAAFPDAQMTLEAICAEGDMVWVRDIWRGTFRAPYYGVPPTGKSVSQEAVDIFQIANGKIVAHWAVSDDLGLQRQLGLLPPRKSVASPAATPAR